jgi:hypothetical protein
MVVVALDITAVQDVVLSPGEFDADDDSGKKRNGEEDHRYDQGRRVGSHR